MPPPQSIKQSSGREANLSQLSFVLWAEWPIRAQYKRPWPKKTQTNFFWIYQLDPSTHWSAQNVFRKMRLTLACLLVVGAAAVAYADPQNPESSFEPAGEDGRSFYTVTLTFSTSTTVTTVTSTTSCTTSTAALSVCTGSGRRRRGLHVSGNKEGRGLFYNENEEQSEQGSIFLPSPAKS